LNYAALPEHCMRAVKALATGANRRCRNVHLVNRERILLLAKQNLLFVAPCSSGATDLPRIRLTDCEITLSQQSRDIPWKPSTLFCAQSIFSSA
jgi:hypothetical protein